ncbi:MAG: SIMPL domain-containing protein [Acetobacteraceae bacterium]|nr:SIMPL domain-containing protein [Acetobacteraceae bacterium]
MHSRSRWIVAVAVLAAAGIGLALAAGRSPAAAAGEEDQGSPRLISVTGEGSVKLQPDTAQVTLGVWAEKPTAREAQSEGNAAAQAVINAVRAEGVAERDVQTVRFSLYPVMRWIEEKGKDELTGFRAEHMLSVTVRDIGRVGRVIDAAVRAGANRIEGVTFQASDPEPARLQALEKAMANARSKADVLARAAGVQIKGLQSVTAAESGYYPGPMKAMMGAGSEAAAPIEPGEVEITATVNVSYEF